MSSVGRSRRVVSVLGVGSGSGKTVVTCGILRGLSSRGFAVQPSKLIDPFREAGVESSTQWHHRRASRSADGLYPFRLVPDLASDSALLYRGTTRIGVVPYIAEDTALLEALPPAELSLVQEAISSLVPANGSDFVVVEGSGSVGDTLLDLPNGGILEDLPADVLLVANVRRSGYAAGLRGAYEILPDRLRAGCKGVILTNVPSGFPLSMKEAVQHAVELPVVATVPHVDGWHRDRPEDTADHTYDALASVLEPLVRLLPAW